MKTKDELAEELYPDELIHPVCAYDDDFIRPRTAEKVAFKTGYDAGSESSEYKIETLEDILRKILGKAHGRLLRGEDFQGALLEIEVMVTKAFAPETKRKKVVLCTNEPGHICDECDGSKRW
jgi:hypothetical protein